MRIGLEMVLMTNFFLHIVIQCNNRFKFIYLTQSILVNCCAKIWSGISRISVKKGTGGPFLFAGFGGNGGAPLDPDTGPWFPLPP